MQFESQTSKKINTNLHALVNIIRVTLKKRKLKLLGNNVTITIIISNKAVKSTWCAFVLDILYLKIQPNTIENLAREPQKKVSYIIQEGLNRHVHSRATADALKRIHERTYNNAYINSNPLTHTHAGLYTH